MIRLPHLLVRFAVLTAIAGTAHAACRVEPLGSVALQLSGGHILIGVAVNDIEAMFIMDTGAERNVDERGGGPPAGTATRRMGCFRHPGPWWRGAKSQRTPAFATAWRHCAAAEDADRRHQCDGRSVAGARGRGPIDRRTARARFPVAIRPRSRPAGAQTNAQRRTWLRHVVPSLDDALCSHPGHEVAGNALVIQTQVDGRAMRTLLDTGASASLITAPGMFLLGLTPALLAHDPGGDGAGVGPAPVPMRLHRFTELRIGPDASRDPHDLGGVGARRSDRRHAAWRGLAAIAPRLAVVCDPADLRCRTPSGTAPSAGERDRPT